MATDKDEKLKRETKYKTAARGSNNTSMYDDVLIV